VNDGPLGTLFNTAVTVDVLANDTPASNAAIDVASLKIKTAPPAAAGTAVVTAGKVVFTPTTGFSGRANMQYEICSVPDPQLPEVVPPCHFANLTVDVAPGVVVAATTTTTAAPAAPATTAAPAPAAQLPVTGSSNIWLAGVGLVALLSGLALVMRNRTKRFVG